MKENLSNRVGRLISGSFNALIDAVENTVPEVVMEEAIRDIDGVIDEVRTELGSIIAGKHMANKRLSEENTSYTQLLTNIEIAIANARDDLAEAAISKQMDIEAQIPILEKTVNDCTIKEKELENYVQALQAKKREMADDLRTFRQAQNLTESTAGDNSRAHSTNNRFADAEKAGAAFDRVMEKASGIALDRNMDAKSSMQLAELQEIAQKNQIQERLLSYKNKLKGDN